MLNLGTKKQNTYSTGDYGIKALSNTSTICNHYSMLYNAMAYKMATPWNQPSVIAFSNYANCVTCISWMSTLPGHMVLFKANTPKCIIDNKIHYYYF